MRILTLLVLLFVGCSTPDHSGEYLAGLAIHEAIAVVTGEASPIDGDDNEPEACFNCGGQGWLGDGTIRRDCPDCEVNWQMGESQHHDHHEEIVPIADYALARAQSDSQAKHLIVLLVANSEEAWLDAMLADPDAVRLLAKQVVHVADPADWSYEKPLALLIDPPAEGSVAPLPIEKSEGAFVTLLKNTLTP